MSLGSICVAVSDASFFKELIVCVKLELCGILNVLVLATEGSKKTVLITIGSVAIHRGGAEWVLRNGANSCSQ